MFVPLYEDKVFLDGKSAEVTLTAIPGMTLKIAKFRLGIFSQFCGTIRSPPQNDVGC